MALGVSGPEALRRFDGAIADMRRMLSEAIGSSDKIAGREAEVRSVQVQVYRDLAKIRLDVIDDLDPGRLDELHSRALELLKQHETFVGRSNADLEAADAGISALEKKRAELAAAHEAAVEKYESEVARVESYLKKDQAYLGLALASESAAAIAARAHQKLTLAKEDLDTKGAPYKSDKLFSYLWKRGFRTPAYKAGLFIRFMDGWVASICKYDSAWMNFQRLSQLPEWLEEHAAEQDRKAATSLKALEDAEHAALEKSGANDLKAQADRLLDEIRRTDQEIDKAEAEHQEIAARHARAMAAEEGPAKEARRLLEEGLQRSNFQDLRSLAAETLAQDDDRLVDRLVKLRTEEMQLELEGQKLAALPDRLRSDLGNLEELRRLFKQARYDSSYAVFASAVIDDVVGGLTQGRTRAEEAIQFLSQAVRRIEPQAQPGFGGQRRSDTIGLPDVLGDVLWEIAKEGLRGGRGYRGGSIDWPSGGSSGRRSPRINFPSGGGRSGGGGGGKRGGGFRTGGGF